MSDVEIDYSEAVRRLKDLIADTTQRKDALNMREPILPQASAGRDFGGHAQRIQSQLARIHSRRNWRLDNINSAARSAISQYDVVKATDEGSADMLNEVSTGDVS